MIKKLMLLLTIPILSGSLAAGDYQMEFSQRIAGAEGFSCIDALVDDSGLLTGFVYCDTSGQRVIVDYLTRDSLIVFDLGGSPVKTVHYSSDEGDTLVIYALFRQPGKTPGICLIKLFPGGALSSNFIPDCYRGYGYISGANHLDIGLCRAADRSVRAIRFETTLRFSDSVFTMGTVSEGISTFILFTPDLETEMLRKNTTSLKIGNLCGDEEMELCSFDNYCYSYDFIDSYGDSSCGRMLQTTVSVTDELDMSLAFNSTYSGNSRRILIGNFLPQLPYEELIYHGYAGDLPGLRPAVVEHVACYSFADDSVREIWYSEVSNITLEYVFRSNHVIAGRSGHDRIVFLDYLDGQLVDSVHLDREPETVTFFETGCDPSVLNLAARAHDTILVYSLYQGTYVWQPAVQAVIPATFTLYQNLPNPFNAETEIRFDNEVTQYLTLIVYNILGQEVARLTAGIFSPGTYYTSWDGVDNRGMVQSSGIYFARLQSGTHSQISKLILLK